VWKHPESDYLWCEKIDIGEEEPRSIASGLQQTIPLENMSGMCFVMANLKERKLGGFPSNGMVLCASDEDHTRFEVLRPPEGATVGERVALEGDDAYGVTPLLAKLNPKKKLWEKAAPSLRTTADGFCAFNDVKWITTAGPVKAEFLDSTIS
jgi:tRNA-binding EMAP/Myf-like protein